MLPAAGSSSSGTTTQHPSMFSEYVPPPHTSPLSSIYISSPHLCCQALDAAHNRIKVLASSPPWQRWQRAWRRHAATRQPGSAADACCCSTAPAAASAGGHRAVEDVSAAVAAAAAAAGRRQKAASGVKDWRAGARRRAERRRDLLAGGEGQQPTAQRQRARRAAWWLLLLLHTGLLPFGSPQLGRAEVEADGAAEPGKPSSVAAACRCCHRCVHPLTLWRRLLACLCAVSCMSQLQRPRLVMLLQLVLSCQARCRTAANSSLLLLPLLSCPCLLLVSGRRPADRTIAVAAAAAASMRRVVCLTC